MWSNGGGIIQKHSWVYLRNRGITKGDILRYGIGYCDSGLYSNRVIIPSYDSDGEDVGLLAGIPIGVKDLEDAKGFVTTYGSELHVNDNPAEEDSILVGRLRDTFSTGSQNQKPPQPNS